MRYLKDLLNALHPRAVERQTQKLDKLTELNRALRRDIQDLQDSVGQLAKTTAAMQARTEQLLMLRREDAAAGAQLARVASIFDVGRVVSHVRAAVAEAEVIQHPFPHIVVSDVFPRDLYDALVEAIPPHMFFEEAPAGTHQIPVPPRLAPLAMMVTWEFLLEQIVKPTLAPALCERFDLSASGACVVESNIVWHHPDRADPPSTNDGSEILTTVVYLGHPGDREDAGARLRAADLRAAHDEVATSVACRPNRALSFLHSPRAHVTTVPSDAPARTERYTFQFRVGATHRPCRPSDP